MLHQVVAIFDKKTGLYGSPALVVHVGEGVREFDTLKNEPGSKINKNPEDFDLHHIGMWDARKGVLEPIPPITLATGV